MTAEAGRPRRAALRALSVLVPLAFYGATASPTPGWADAALVAGAAARLELGAWVNQHNLFVVLGHAWMVATAPWLEPWVALNSLSASFGALTVSVVFAVGLRLTGSALAAALGALALLVSHSLWWHSTMLEVYTLNTLLIASMVLFVLRHEQRGSLADLCAAVFCLGLGCSNHALMGLFGAGFLALGVLRSERRSLLRPGAAALLGASFLLGFALYLGVFAAELAGRMGHGASWGDFVATLRAMLDETTGGEFRRFMFPAGLSLAERAGWAGFYAALLVYNFPSPALVFGCAGCVALLRRSDLPATRTFLGVSLALQVAWSSSYLVWDMYAFALPVYVLFGIAIAPGFARVLSRGGVARGLALASAPLLVLPCVLYAVAPRWAGASEAARAALGRLPQYEQAAAFWDPLAYFLDPNKRGYDQVERYASHVLATLEPGACYWGDEAKLLYPLQYYYQEVLGIRPDVSYQLVFGMVTSEAELRAHALLLVRQLERGCPVHVASLGAPERLVLDRAFVLLDPRAAPARVEAMSERELMGAFPRYRFEPLPLETGGPHLYRMRQRGP